jgi:hypothetical protein
MSGKTVTGSCLCGAVHYQITGNMGVFQYCHCSRCRKFTGSAHASNLFVSPAEFHWTKGEDSVGTYSPDFTKYFATAFCKHCGSSLPWLSKSGNVVVIPAGTLDGDPGIKPGKNIFCGSGAAWYSSAEALPRYDEMPPAKK